MALPDDDGFKSHLDHRFKKGVAIRAWSAADSNAHLSYLLAWHPYQRHKKGHLNKQPLAK